MAGKGKGLSRIEAAKLYGARPVDSTAARVMAPSAEKVLAEKRRELKKKLKGAKSTERIASLEAEIQRLTNTKSRRKKKFGVREAAKALERAKWLRSQPRR